MPSREVWWMKTHSHHVIQFAPFTPLLRCDVRGSAEYMQHFSGAHLISAPVNADVNAIALSRSKKN